MIAPHPLARLRFDGVRVPAENRLGKPGDGFKVAMATLDVFRSTVGAAALGFARRALHETVEHAATRKLFGAPLGELQMTQATIADSATEVDAAALLVYALVPVMMGMIARGMFPGLANHELALPTLLTKALPLWLGALLLGAIFSAELSAADAALFMLSTSLSKDLYKAFISPGATDERLMRVAKISAIACGVAGAVLGSFLPTVISALKIFYTLLSAALLLPLIAGLYTRRVKARSAVLSMVTSVVITFAFELFTGGKGVSGVPSLFFGIAAGLLVMVTVNALLRQTA